MKLTKGKICSPTRIVVYGTEGIGKSSFAAGASNVVFLGTENGTGHLDVSRMEEPKTLKEVTALLKEMRTESHEFKALAVDTVDWLEPMIWKHVCERAGKPNIEAFSYGKGYASALEQWRNILSSLEELRHERGMSIILVAHAQIKAFKNPEADDYDRYSLKLHKSASELIKEWADCVLFANYETTIDDTKERSKPKQTDRRLIYTRRMPAYDAKNRFNLPPSLPLKWSDFESKVKAFYADTKPQPTPALQPVAAAPRPRNEAELVIRSLLANAKSIKELESVGAQIRQAHTAGAITEAARKHLGVVYLQRKKELPAESAGEGTTEAAQ